MAQVIAVPPGNPCSVCPTGSSGKTYFRTSKRRHRMATAAADEGVTEPSESLRPAPPPSYLALCCTSKASALSVKGAGPGPSVVPRLTTPSKDSVEKRTRATHSSPRMDKVGEASLKLTGKTGPPGPPLEVPFLSWGREQAGSYLPPFALSHEDSQDFSHGSRSHLHRVTKRGQPNPRSSALLTIRQPIELLLPCP